MIVLIWLLWCLSNTSSNLLHSQKSDGLIANNVIQKSCISSKLLNDADIQSSNNNINLLKPVMIPFVQISLKSTCFYNIADIWIPIS